MSSLAEATTTNTQPSNTNQPLPLLEESLELFQRCLALQEYLFTESQSQALAAMDTSDPDLEDGGASLSSEPTASSNAPMPMEQEEQWASIVEPVTHETLVDTIVAQLEVLTLVCGLTNNDSRMLSFIEEYASPLLTLKLPTYAKELSPEINTASSITAATFISAVSDANFQSQRTDASTYWETLQKTWNLIDLTKTPEGLVSAAEALLSFNTAVARNSNIPPPSVLSTRWKALSPAQDYLLKASTLPDVDKLAKIYLLRGDVDILRFQLGTGEAPLEIAKKSQTVLVKNAEKFYRGAKKLAAADEVELVMEAGVKEGLAKAFGGDEGALRGVVKEVGEKVARGLLVECWEEGLVGREELEGWGL